MIKETLTRARQQLNGKAAALEALAQQTRHLSNGLEVFRAYRQGRRLPPLKLRSGLELQHGLEDDAWALFREIFVERCYTRSGFYRPRPGDTVLDCGANIGFFALHVQHLAPGTRVHCFEPAAATRQRLARNIAGNGLSDAIIVHPVAVMDQAGQVELCRAAQAGDSRVALAPEARRASASAGSAAATETVEAVALIGALARCGADSVDLLKIDVEGAEVEILAGAPATVWPRIRRLALEYHEHLRPGCRALLTSYLRRHFRHVASWPTSARGDLGMIQAWH